ncbi:MAG: hypothetical protein IIA54_03965, partial [Chloroflexi bacterium]|nr:hypothetical protein [Chloroflexota bacterium]
MRLCLFAKGSATHVGSYTEETVVDLTGLARVLGEAVPREPLDLLGPGRETIRRREMLAERMGKAGVIIVFEPDVALLRAVFERIDHSSWLRNSLVVWVTDPDDRGALARKLDGSEAIIA